MFILQFYIELLKLTEPANKQRWIHLILYTLYTMDHIDSYKEYIYLRKKNTINKWTFWWGIRFLQKVVKLGNKLKICKLYNNWNCKWIHSWGALHILAGLASCYGILGVVVGGADKILCSFPSGSLKELSTFWWLASFSLLQLLPCATLDYSL